MTLENTPENTPEDIPEDTPEDITEGTPRSASRHTPLFTRVDPGRGTFALRPLAPRADAPLLHPWLTHPKAAFWLMQDAGPHDVEKAYAAIAADPHHDAFLGLHQNTPAFLVERYDPAYVELVGLYEPADGDTGMHFLTAPSEVRLPGFTLAVLTTVMEFLFADPATQRVVVEPDVRNTAVHRLNRAVGFVPAREISTPEKRALLSFCTREQFITATAQAPATAPATAAADAEAEGAHL